MENTLNQAGVAFSLSVLKRTCQLIIFFVTTAGAFADETDKSAAVVSEVNLLIKNRLSLSLQEYQARSAAALIMNAQTGEVIASASIEKDAERKKTDIISEGLFEFGSSARLVTFAAGLEAKKISINSRIDAVHPLKIGRFTIGDHYPQRRILSISEIVLYSSNIGAAKIALKVGPEYQTLFRRSLGLYDPIEFGPTPIMPKENSEIITAANAFGHGFAITPLHAASVFASLTSKEGRVVRPSFVKGGSKPGYSIVAASVTAEVRKMLRSNVEIGAAKVVDVAGYDVGAMTATAEKVENGSYSPDRLVTSVIAVAPASDPQFVFLTLFDEPQASDSSDGYKTAAWNAGPVMADIIRDTAEGIGLHRIR